MGQLGAYALLLGLVLAGYGTVAAAVGAKTGRAALVESARRTAFGLLVTIVVVNVAMLVALLSNNFTLRYVADNSSLETPTFFKALSLWAADDGSLLLWNLILAGYLAAVALRFRRDRPSTFPYALSVLFAALPRMRLFAPLPMPLVAAPTSSRCSKPAPRVQLMLLSTVSMPPALTVLLMVMVS